MTQYLLGKTQLRQADFQASEGIFRALAKQPHKWLQCQANYALADLSSSLSEFSQAIHFSRQAFTLAEQIGDTGLAVRSLAQLAEWDQTLGETQRSMVALQRALAFASTTPMEAMERWILNVRLSDSLAELGYIEAALAYQTEALRLAREADRPLQASRSYSYLGAMLGSQGKIAAALQAYEQACTLGENLTDANMQQNILGFSLLGLAHQQRIAGQFTAARSSYSRALRINEQLGLPYAHFEAIRGRLLTEIAQNDEQAAQQDLREGLEVFERNRTKITEETKRSSFFAREQDIYDIAIQITAHTNPGQAYEYSETSRARSLLDLMRNGLKLQSGEPGDELYLTASASPLSPAELQRRLPGRVKIIQYAVLREELLIWVVSREGIQHTAVPVTLERLQQQTSDYLKLIARHETGEIAACQRAAQRLYQLLIQPVAHFLHEEDRLCFVPDKMLNHLPFGALFSEEKGKYLLEMNDVMTAPSANAFLLCTETAARKPIVLQESVLSVGNPRFNRHQPETKELPDLPQAEREAREIASLYPISHLLVGGAARESVIQKQMEQVDVIHLATHGIAHVQSSLQSKLLLAEEPANYQQADGMLQAKEIYRLRLRRARLVVLSACQSGIEKYFRGEGMIGLARPFLVAGAPSVVASLWQVQSEATAQLMTTFHRLRRQQREPSIRAIRHAQSEFLHNAEPRYRHPYYWAAFSLIGGMTSY